MEGRISRRTLFQIGTAAAGAFLIESCIGKEKPQIITPTASPPPWPTLSPEDRAYLDFLMKQKDELIRIRGPELNVCLEWPATGPISQRFSPSHKGIDIDGYLDPNQAIKAAYPGKVLFSGGNTCCGYGLYVILEHEEGIFTLYAHLSKLGVEKGKEVKIGEKIGNEGRTGYSTGNHLHFEVLKSRDGMLNEARESLIPKPTSYPPPTPDIYSRKPYPLYSYNPLEYLQNSDSQKCP